LNLSSDTISSGFQNLLSHVNLHRYAWEHHPQLQVLMQVFDLDECHFVQYKPAGTGVGFAGVMNEDRPVGGLYKLCTSCIQLTHSLRKLFHLSGETVLPIR
jgi:hypothetical protein